MPVTLLCGDITQAKVDAIVNAANTRMLGGGGVDGAIHRAAGPDLLAACYAVPEVEGVRCPVGQARITAAGNLPARYVIHTVGPRFEFDDDPPALLASAYRTSFELALGNDCRSIAFPAISCGVYGYPMAQAAEIALTVCLDQRYRQLEEYLYLHQQADLEAWTVYLPSSERAAF
ncbi:O-acetyl-ADP-ribose deacetylase [Aliagarivorans taiwanensis]|uniref:O-acetyl-ADP-ribose deacetylase n=1 Tax=Aliagarivorans taiwanensis TaxID=561966 RepID=UPI000687293B|nr:O-acetyl-ADP-ribose deacetylase [Aliagarivorans taiwanensis]